MTFMASRWPEAVSCAPLVGGCTWARLASERVLSMPVTVPGETFKAAAQLARADRMIVLGARRRSGAIVLERNSRRVKLGTAKPPVRGPRSDETLPIAYRNFRTQP